MENMVLDFFATWGRAITAMSGVVTAASALIALVHYLRHWRDDEVRLTVDVDAEKAETDRGECSGVVLNVHISNVGKVAATVTGLELVDKRLCKDFELLCDLNRGIFLRQGASGEVCAVLHAKKPDVAYPKFVAVRCKWPRAAKSGEGVAVVESAKARAAGK